MRQTRIHLLMSVAAFALASMQAATAADLPRRAVMAPAAAPVPYVVPAYSWTGFYAGGNLGWGWGDGDGTIGITGVGTGPTSGSGDGFLGGVQAGYNWQNGAFVFGVETDIQASAAQGDVTGSPGAATLTAESKHPWFGTIRGRIGYANDRWLWYVTGGALYGEAKLSGTVSAPGAGAFSSSQSLWSWTLGGGVETALWDRWSAKLEYLYVGTPSDVPTPPGTTSISGDTSSHIVRAGLNYHF
jgi:outer membrane immunogenic protein